jgi:hypothetical protein
MLLPLVKEIPFGIRQLMAEIKDPKQIPKTKTNK